ncbi:MAG: bifunctional alpha,alpha-trehalose-phosphate synthase (UDP-forming)/trehalose-phosphatase [Thermodesulfobacteriota bacterium]
MNKLIIVSNRLPITIDIDSKKFNIKPSIGGLATGVGSLKVKQKKLWIGWPGLDINKSAKRESLIRHLKNDGLYPVFLTEQEIDEYYHGFSNETIWPLFHYFVQYAIYNKVFWNAYKEVNERFCEAVLEVAKPDDIIWIHDYHLMLLPKMIREKIPNAQIGFFLHIPFPSSEIFRLIPWCKELVEGLLGSDLIGFHTFDYVRHFGESVRRILGIEHHLGQFTVDKRPIKTDVFPMGIDYAKYSNAPKKRVVKEKVKRIKRRIGGNYKNILSIDRLDYTKGIIQRLEAYKLFLKNNPNYRDKVIFFLIIVPSRTEVPHYKQLKDQIDNLVGNINGEYGTLGWNPIRYLYRSFNFNDLIALYSLADILFITPLRDGMNLVAKEFVASKTNGKGVLILGEMAGTAKELGEAIVINPNDVDQTANSLKMAIDMPENEQKDRLSGMQKRLQRYDLKRWASDFIDSLNKVKQLRDEMYSTEISIDTMKKLSAKYKKRKNCLFLLDYDGSLVQFDKDPLNTKPDAELTQLLRQLSNNKKNEVVIISGRDKDIPEKWLGKMVNGLAAEHGIWIKDNSRWRTIEQLSVEWKEEIKPILDLFVDRTPNSFIEEKDYSLAWHFRKVDPALAIVRVGELKDTLSHKMVNLEVGVLEGNKVVEVKFSGINKGRAALHWLAKKDWDLIISIGDDWTDEDIFEVLPEDSVSIKVGHGASKAKYRLPNVHYARDFLTQLSKIK